MKQIVLLAALSVLGLGLARPALAETSETVVAYTEAGTALEGILVRPVDDENALRPGILLVHQWLGLSDYERERAAMLAELGYIVLCADIYGVDQRPAGQEEAGAKVGEFYGDRELFRARVRAGLETLRLQPGVDPLRLAAIGYCFGGSGVLELARSGADLAGVVCFHGVLDPASPTPWNQVKAKILICHGALDPFAPAEQVAACEADLTAAMADWQLIMYGGAVHSFTQWDAAMPGQAEYNPLADMRSWGAMLSFFDELFLSEGC